MEAASSDQEWPFTKAKAGVSSNCDASHLADGGTACCSMLHVKGQMSIAMWVESLRYTCLNTRLSC